MVAGPYLFVYNFYLVVNKIVCITGLPGSGKSIVSDYFVDKDFLFLRFGQITLDEIKKRGIELSEANERAIREGFRKEHGMAAYAILNLPKLDELIKKGHVIADGLYSFEEYKALKEHFRDSLKVIAVYAPPHLRYKRLTERKLEKDDKNARNRPLTVNEAKTRDLSEIENLNKGGSIAMADYTVLNTKDLTFLEKQIEEIYEEIIEN